jgi:hypothetical protein
MMKFSALLLSTTLTVACVPSTYEEQLAADDAGRALSVVVMSAAFMSVGFIPGLAFLPYLIEQDIHHTNREMETANTNATIDQTYRYAYDRPLSTVSANGSTGVIFRDMKSASRQFQTVLRGHGVQTPENYILTATRTADTQGFTLYSLIHRPARSIQVRDSRGRIRTLTAADEGFYTPHRQDASGRPLDVAIDWAGVPRTQISTQKGQAILMTLGANSVLINRRSNDFWQVQERWIAGGYKGVVAERKRVIEQRLG